MTIIMILLAVAGGAMLSIQAAINGQLGSKVGVFKSAFLTFSVGALVTGLLIFFFEPKHTLTLMEVPKWQLLGAMFGVPYIVIMVLAVQRIGAAVATVAVIFGQLTMSMLIDNFGWLGNASIPFSMSRLGAIVCLGIALFFIYSSSKSKAATAKTPRQQENANTEARPVQVFSLKSARNILTLFRCYTAMPWAYYRDRNPVRVGFIPLLLLRNVV